MQQPDTQQPDRPVLLVDLDGTLIDTLPALVAALNDVLGKAGLAPFAPAEVRGFVGDGLAPLLTRALAARGREFDEGLLAAFRARYEADPAAGCAPFPGAREALAALRAEGVGLALCTNKPQAPSESLLRRFGLRGLFEALGCGDSFPHRKPDPRHPAATLALLGTGPGRAVLLGDHANDVAAARGLGIPALFAGWGYGGGGMAAGSARILNRFDELPEAFAALMAGG